MGEIVVVADKLSLRAGRWKPRLLRVRMPWSFCGVGMEPALGGRGRSESTVGGEAELRLSAGIAAAGDVGEAAPAEFSAVTGDGGEGGVGLGSVGLGIG